MLLECCLTVCIKFHCRQTQKVKVVYPDIPFICHHRKVYPPLSTAFGNYTHHPLAQSLTAVPLAIIVLQFGIHQTVVFSLLYLSSGLASWRWNRD